MERTESVIYSCRVCGVEEVLLYPTYRGWLCRKHRLPEWIDLQIVLARFAEGHRRFVGDESSTFSAS
jgi:hypothetical protein